MSEPAQPIDPNPAPEADGGAPPPTAKARPSHDGGPHAGASLDLPMSSPD